jgi:hypothetical protein
VIDPFDHTLRATLGEVRIELRRQAVDFQEKMYRRRSVSPFSMGVPPEFERMTNDPRFGSPARDAHKG